MRIVVDISKLSEVFFDCYTHHHQRESQKTTLNIKNPILYQSQVVFGTWLIKSIHIIHSVKCWKPLGSTTQFHGKSEITKKFEIANFNLPSRTFVFVPWMSKMSKFIEKAKIRGYLVTWLTEKFLKATHIQRCGNLLKLVLT